MENNSKYKFQISPIGRVGFNTTVKSDIIFKNSIINSIRTLLKTNINIINMKKNIQSSNINNKYVKSFPLLKLKSMNNNKSEEYNENALKEELDYFMNENEIVLYNDNEMEIEEYYNNNNNSLNRTKMNTDIITFLH